MSSKVKSKAVAEPASDAAVMPSKDAIVKILSERGRMRVADLAPALSVGNTVAAGQRQVDSLSAFRRPPGLRSASQAQTVLTVARL